MYFFLVHIIFHSVNNLNPFPYLQNESSKKKAAKPKEGNTI